MLCLGIHACAFSHPLVGLPDLPEDDSLFSLLGLVAVVGTAGSDGPNSTTYLRYVYVSESGADEIGMYAAADATGVLTALSPASIAAGGSNPRALIKHPASDFLYSANQSANSISKFAIQSDGQLSALTPATVATAGTAPTEITMTADGRFGYAGFNTASGIEAYSVDPTTGQWSFVATLAGCGGARELAIHPNGSYFYALCSSGAEIRRHSLSSGVLTYLGSTTGIGAGSNGLSITPDGRFLYTTSQNTNSARMFSVDTTTGNLTSLATPSVATDAWPAEIVADPTGRFVYVANGASNTVNMYSIDGATGLLTSNGLLATGNGPRGFAFVTETIVE